MSLTLKFISIVFLSIALGCNATHSTLQESNTSNIEMKNRDKQLLEEGYILGVVKYNAKSDCPYTITDLGNSQVYDPINIDEETFIEFKSNNMNVYFKFHPLRRANRCNEAQPVQLLSIKKRED